MEFDYKSKRWKIKRLAISRRDKYLCQRCLRYGRKREAKLVHHIEPVEVKPERAYDLTNLQSLCEACHNSVHPEKGGTRPGRSVE